MEVELKYQIPDTAVIDKMWRKDVFAGYGEIDDFSQVNMDALYYDTADFRLSSVDAAFRLRREDDTVIATLKWDGTQHGGLHEREELNITVNDDSVCSHPSLKIFEQSEEGRRLLELVGDDPLEEKMRMTFLRRLMRVDTGNAICEVALDTGKIITAAGELPIRELELELYSGDIADIKKLGKKLSEKFKIVPGTESKFLRGLNLLRAGISE